MRLLILYDKFSTFTNTVFDHLESFKKYSQAEVFYYYPESNQSDYSLDYFDTVVIHYSLRIPLGQVSDNLKEKLRRYTGQKILFLQDEYDYTENVRAAILDLNIGMVFTCVPSEHVNDVYPQKRFQTTKFINNLTGYIPEDLLSGRRSTRIEKRPIYIGYRGRKLPYWYGDLGQEKYLIARYMDSECKQRGIASDIEWEDKNRIYGSKWIDFLSSCRVTLGTESGCNVFDEYGEYRNQINEILRNNKNVSYADVRLKIFGDREEVKIMNQISPRLFEAIALGTGLVLYEGEYSGILNPYEHYIPLKKDHSNVEEVFSLLVDEKNLQAMIDRAYRDIIMSDRYSYSSFIKMFDSHLFGSRDSRMPPHYLKIVPGYFDNSPARIRITKLRSGLTALWGYLPNSIRHSFRPLARRVVELVSRAQ